MDGDSPLVTATLSSAGVAAVRDRSAAGLGEGTVVGRYVVVGRLGRGGMGDVYRAEDPELGRPVAIKMLSAGRARGDAASARLLREARALARLSHRNVVPIYDVGTFGDDVFLAMALVKGQTLRRWWERKPGWREIVDVLVQVGRGLAAAHLAGVIHRDVKPENIIVDEAGSPCVLDFGLARAVDAAPDEPASLDPDAVMDLTQTGSVVGTPGYMAPEQHEGKKADAPADQFALFVTLYEALHGQRPFVGDTIAELAASLREGRRHPPSRDVRLPARVTAVIDRGLAREPGDRFPSMTDAMDALERAARPPAWRGWALAGVAATALAAAALVSISGQTDACATAGDLGDVWGPAARARLAQVIGDPDVLAPVTRELDAAAGRWSEASGAACRRVVERSRPESALLLEGACVARRRSELAGALTALQAGHASSRASAVDIVLALEDARACGDPELLARGAPLPSEPDVRARIERAEETLAEARALQSAARFAEASERVATLETEVTTLAYAPLTARWLSLRGALAADLREADAVATLRRAATAASAARDDLLAARAWILMFDVMVDQKEEANRLGDLDELVPVLDALVAAAAEQEVALRWLLQKARFRAVAGDSERTVKLFEEALTEARRRLGEDHLVTAAAAMSLAQAYAIEQGRTDLAEPLLERALEIRARRLGALHPQTLAVHSVASRLALQRGDHEKVVQTTRRVLEGVERSLGPDHPKAAEALDRLASAHSKLGNFDEARALSDRSLAIHAGRTGPETGAHALSLISRGNLESVAGALDEAETFYARAEKALRASFGEEHSQMAILEVSRAALRRKQGRCAEAEPGLRRARAIFEKRFSPSHFTSITAAAGLGGCLFVVGGRDAEAIPLLERGVDCEACDADVRFTARHDLGRLLWSRGDRARGRALIDEAVEITGVSASRQPEVAAARAWLAAH